MKIEKLPNNESKGNEIYIYIYVKRNGVLDIDKRHKSTLGNKIILKIRINYTKASKEM